jgi:hypothetical protein
MGCDGGLLFLGAVLDWQFSFGSCSEEIDCMARGAGVFTVFEDHSFGGLTIMEGWFDGTRMFKYNASRRLWNAKLRFPTLHATSLSCSQSS